MSGLYLVNHDAVPVYLDISTGKTLVQQQQLGQRKRNQTVLTCPEETEPDEQTAAQCYMQQEQAKAQIAQLQKHAIVQTDCAGCEHTQLVKAVKDQNNQVDHIIGPKQTRKDMKLMFKTGFRERVPNLTLPMTEAEQEQEQTYVDLQTCESLQPEARGAPQRPHARLSSGCPCRPARASSLAIEPVT